MVTFWIIPLIVMAVLLAVTEWTSSPRRAKGSPEDVAVPRPRKEIRDDVTSGIKRYR